MHFYEAWLLQGALQLQPRELLPGSANARLSPVQRFQRWCTSVVERFCSPAPRGIE